MTRYLIRFITLYAALYARAHKPDPNHVCRFARVSYYAETPGRCLYGCTCGKRIVQ